MGSPMGSTSQVAIRGSPMGLLRFASAILRASFQTTWSNTEVRIWWWWWWPLPDPSLLVPFPSSAFPTCPENTPLYVPAASSRWAPLGMQERCWAQGLTTGIGGALSTPTEHQQNTGTANRTPPEHQGQHQQNTGTALMQPEFLVLFCYARHKINRYGTEVGG